MNDLFSTQSFKRYTDLKEQARLDEMESGEGSGPAVETVNLEKFFEDVENVKEDLKGLEQLYKRLQDLNEETKIAHNANTMKDLRSKMDRDIEQVLKKAKVFYLHSYNNVKLLHSVGLHRIDYVHSNITVINSTFVVQH